MGEVMVLSTYKYLGMSVCPSDSIMTVLSICISEYSEESSLCTNPKAVLSNDICGMMLLSRNDCRGCLTHKA